MFVNPKSVETFNIQGIKGDKAMPFCIGPREQSPAPRGAGQGNLGLKGNHHKVGRRKEMEETFFMLLENGKRALFIRDPTTCLN